MLHAGGMQPRNILTPTIDITQRRAAARNCRLLGLCGPVAVVAIDFKPDSCHGDKGSEL